MAKKRRSKTKARKEPDVTQPDQVEPTTERFSHDAIERARGSRGRPWGDRPPFRVMTQNCLDRYLHGRTIDQGQHDAGMRLYREWRATGVDPRVVGGYLVRIDGPSSLTAHQAEMRLEVDAAMAAVGPLAWRVLFHVCCCNLSAKEWALARGYRPNLAKSVGIVFLKEALDELRRHYEGRARGRLPRQESA